MGGMTARVVANRTRYTIVKRVLAGDGDWKLEVGEQFTTKKTRHSWRSNAKTRNLFRVLSLKFEI